MSHKPERSTARKVSTSPDVFKSAGRGGFSGSAKSGRGWNVSEKRPYGNDGRPGGRKGDR
ncbi:hypothetical protein [Micromonospora taraxaci]|uniref:hypothetical protein n=1 Tax=Micromonospora taraxaci TaxID=1316803 RepID=UPI0033B3049C